MEKLMYMCPNTECPDLDLNEKLSAFWIPIYENVNLNEGYSVESLMDLFSEGGERCYFSLHKAGLVDMLVRVTRVNAEIENDELKICFHFENGFEYEPCREFLIGEDGDYTEDDARVIVDACQKAAPHLFFLKKECCLVNNDLKFEFEYYS